MSEGARLHKIIDTKRLRKRNNSLITSFLGIGGDFNLLLE